ncbi:hypothetical protein GCM10025868_29280 [Angustibacter aerolatus]|uniref:Aminoglycoside phosphotransferase domain-containing protein n=1 Tax=Angustibacter aerolatus TaxID=1162965 RepID=A0ABQ6JJT6_9ACTN|nr:phosphotransferase [Angustibacter aerolatus]GMA87678.1 hypothetical protein GCM10025868_29280 [Angustibacter aerolatus]
MVDAALRIAGERADAADPASCVIVHGDPHPGNALRVRRPRAGAPAGVALVDPDGFVGDPAYDLGVVLRDWSVRLLADDDPAATLRRWSHRLAAATGHDEQVVYDWALLERVSTGLYVADLGADRVARPFLDVAARLVG